MSQKIGQVFLKKKGQFKKRNIKIYYTANIQITLASHKNKYKIYTIPRITRGNFYGIKATVYSVAYIKSLYIVRKFVNNNLYIHSM